MHRWYAPGTGRYTRPDPLRDTTIFQIYGYAEQNALRWVDEDGQRPLLGLWTPIYPADKVGCVGGAVARAAAGLVGIEGPRWAHCMASCQIAKCGGKSLARDMGLLKESFDTATCLALKKLGKRGGGLTRLLRDKQCESAFQPEDFDDNELGISCPVDVPCETRCKDLIDIPNTAPGPFAN